MLHPDDAFASWMLTIVFGMQVLTIVGSIILVLYIASIAAEYWQRHKERKRIELILGPGWEDEYLGRR